MSDHHGQSLAELRGRPMVFVDDLERPVLSPEDHHHLQRALRLPPGSPITVADGRGRWRAARLAREPAVDGPVVAEAPPSPPLCIGFAPVKGDRSDLVVQKLTELGIDTIVPLVTERSVVRWDERRVARNLDRHRRIAREAAMQSRNPWLPTIEPATTLADFVAARPGTALADPAGGPPGDFATIAIGPEGGFGPAELAGRPLVSLPGRILRTETAAIAAAVVLTARRG